MKRFNKNISVVFPAYNEEENIEVCVLIAHCILKEIVDDFEIIIVNDGSTDATKEICDSLSRRFKEIRVISKERNDGYGFALRDGFGAARYDLVFFSDSDRQFDIVNLKDLLDFIDSYDIVIGFRKHRSDPLKRRFLSRGYNVLIRLIFGVSALDIDCAFKLFKKRVFDKIKIESQWYFVNTEILAKAAYYGFSIKEVGVSHFPRYKGESKIRITEIPRTMRELCRIYKLLHSAKEKA
jgi:glycosyltransferase involved in cell wall biosynthesis